MPRDDGFKNSAIPEPGVSSLRSTAGYQVRKEAEPSPDGCPPPGVTVAGGGIRKKARDSHLPPHLREQTDRNYVLSHFEAAPYGAPSEDGEQGYVVQIPLDPKRSAPSVVRSGALPRAKYEKNAHYYEDNQPPARRAAPVATEAARNLSEDEIEEDPRFARQDELEGVEHVASELPQLNQIPSYTPAGEGKTKRLVNKPIDPERPGEAKVGPGDWMDSKRKQQYDTQRSTKLPWDEFKNPYKAAAWRNDRVEKLASAVGLDLARYQAAPVWARSTPALLLDLIMLAHFGKDWLSWEPATVRETLVRAGLATEQDVDIVFEKTMAVQVLHACDIFWENWGAFEKICLALLGKDIDPQRLQPLTIEDMARAITIAQSLPGLRNKTFSDEVLGYVAAKVRASAGHDAIESRIGLDGLVYLPPPLEAAQPFLDRLQPVSAPLAPQIRHAYMNNWPVTNGADPLNIQLDKCYRLRAYVQAP